jgi:hypothetical protein
MGFTAILNEWSVAIRVFLIAALLSGAVMPFLVQLVAAALGPRPRPRWLFVPLGINLLTTILCVMIFARMAGGMGW